MLVLRIESHGASIACGSPRRRFRRGTRSPGWTAVGGYRARKAIVANVIAIQDRHGTIDIVDYYR